LGARPVADVHQRLQITPSTRIPPQRLVSELENTQYPREVALRNTPSSATWSMGSNYKFGLLDLDRMTISVKYSQGPGPSPGLEARMKSRELLSMGLRDPQTVLFPSLEEKSRALHHRARALYLSPVTRGRSALACLTTRSGACGGVASRSHA
jgi:hypothetical protein